MQKIIPLVFAFTITAAPVLAWGEGGCSFSKKNKESKELTKEQVENSYPSKK
tara:strand:+ start:646 stop:801 length:156 start_codon:yes stop_codon:yes gene_type:complete